MTHANLSQINDLIDPLLVLHQGVLAYPGGVVAVAKQIGRSQGVMYNKLSEQNGSALSVREATAVALILFKHDGNQKYIEALCQLHDGFFVPSPEMGAAGDDDLLASQLAAGSAMGDMMQELISARADGVITREEATAFALRGRRVQARIQHWIDAVWSQVREIEPRPANVSPMRG